MEMRIARALAYGVTLALAAALVMVSMGGARTAEAQKVPPYAPEVAKEDGKYAPKIDRSDFVRKVDNPYFPLEPGTRFVYEGETEDGNERILVDVTYDTKKILGVECTVVRDRAYLDGELVEDTFDWYAQDKKGNVWYFGEDTTEYKNGVPGSTAGSFEAGKDGAKPGIVMKADPQVGNSYRQEYYKGEALDMAEVLSLREEASVPYGSFDNVLLTKEWTPLEPEVLEHKYYAKGVGNIGEVAVRGGKGRIELVNIVPPE